MAHLSIVGSHKVNGVSALHSDLLVQTIFADFASLWPDRFTNMTNGVTPRRWLAQANPGLAALIDSTIGSGWRLDLDQLQRLRAARRRQPASAPPSWPSSAPTSSAWRAHRAPPPASRSTRPACSTCRSSASTNTSASCSTCCTWWRATRPSWPTRTADWVPRTVIFAGKAASSYVAAKNIIRLIHDVGAVINHDPRIGGRLKVVFVPNYGVSVAEVIMPGPTCRSRSPPPAPRPRAPAT
jgi:glycogen phosphorylase